MSNADTLSGNPYANFGDTTVAEAVPAARVDFIRKTYTHLAMAIYALAALEWAYFQTGIAEKFGQFLLGAPMGMLIMLGAFLVTGWIARSWAESDTSIGMQYGGLSLYVLAESIFLMPFLWIAQNYTMNLEGVGEVNVIGAAAVATLLIFGGLTAIAWFSGADFSFMRAGLGIAGMAAFAAIVVSFIFPGFILGTWFSVGMILLASAYILYDTSNVMHHYRPGQHVAASLALFASVALLFWYVLRLFLAFSSDD